jgi:hypothetical protein
MSDSPTPNKRKSIFLKAAGFGAGFAICFVVLACAVYWYMHRQRPWNANALKGTFAGLSIQTQPQNRDYKLDLQFDIENATNRDYDFNPYNLTLMCVTPSGNSLSKEVGNYESGEASLDGPSFIPAHGKGRITIHLAYFYPNEFTPQDKGDAAKVGSSVGRRLKEINGLVLFDKSLSYRIELPSGWQKWNDNTLEKSKAKSS